MHSARDIWIESWIAPSSTWICTCLDIWGSWGTPRDDARWSDEPPTNMVWNMWTSGSHMTCPKHSKPTFVGFCSFFFLHAFPDVIPLRLRMHHGCMILQGCCTKLQLYWTRERRRVLEQKWRMSGWLEHLNVLVRKHRNSANRWQPLAVKTDNPNPRNSRTVMSIWIIAGQVRLPAVIILGLMRVE